MANQNGSDSKQDGVTFNIKLEGAIGADGKKTWTAIGRAFIRKDLSGGALYVGEGDNVRKYSLFPRTPRVHKAGSEAANGAQRPATEAGGGAL